MLEKAIKLCIINNQQIIDVCQARIDYLKYVLLVGLDKVYADKETRAQLLKILSE